ncbi:hypothetical protein [Agromyces ramosus]|uniref:hypothetical protein n=1 Tax=Agromyces ramosus TaxID=33879 RepID=UPI00102B0E9B|nr:hypothetical protein [Agromyces ramosus]
MTAQSVLPLTLPGSGDATLPMKMRRHAVPPRGREMSAIIEVEIGPGADPGTYDARVIRAPGGAPGRLNFSLDIDSILERLPTVEAVVLASAVSARRTLTANESEIHRLGG